jgi:hypothetical protein
VSSAFKRYDGLLGDRFVSYETVALGGRLITADARLNGLLTASRAAGHVSGPVSRPEWAAIAQDARAILHEFDAAWSLYQADMTPDTAAQDDARLRVAMFDVLTRLEALNERFPQHDGLIDW